MLTHTGTVTLETPRLLLRRLDRSDAKMLHANWGSSEEVYKYMTTPIMPNLYDVENFIEKKLRAYFSPDFYYWGVVEKSSGELIGMATLTEVSEFGRTANLAYSLGVPWWGKGYAREAGAAVLAHAFETVGFRKIYGCHFTENDRSGRVLLALGMEHTGQGKNKVWQLGRYLTYEGYELSCRRYTKLKRGRA
ncbi:MAG: GNAT family N-acetyltransferase [Ruminococcaceae bacterium]|nr:GNAT family N-acetyltransferase [Oscillospiraceae bacterium]MBQ8897849.1 GNAT family N-acetyltransferase [Clostridia bacterium]